MRKKIKPFTLNLGNGESTTITEVEDDVDLDAEPLTLGDGTVLDNKAAEAYGDAVADRAWDARRGRPSLSGDRAKSPHIGVRVTPQLRDALGARAAREGKTLSQIAREALEAYAH